MVAADVGVGDGELVWAKAVEMPAMAATSSERPFIVNTGFASRRIDAFVSSSADRGWMGLIIREW